MGERELPDRTLVILGCCGVKWSDRLLPDTLLPIPGSRLPDWVLNKIFKKS